MKPVPEFEDRLLKMDEVARLTGLALGSIYHLVSQGRLPVVRLSARCIRTRLSDLHEWWKQHTENSG